MVPGKFKDESPANQILEFVGLRSKMYSMMPKEGDKKAVAKVVSNKITKRELRHKDYRECLMNSEEMYHSSVNIESLSVGNQDLFKKVIEPF